MANRRQNFKPHKFAGTLLGLRIVGQVLRVSRRPRPHHRQGESSASVEYPKELCTEYAKLMVSHLHETHGQGRILGVRMKKVLG